jgi:hypothetical protein
LNAYGEYFSELLDQASDDIAQKLRNLLGITLELAQSNIERDIQENAREVSSLLYHTACAITFAWEAGHEGMSHRRQLLEDVVRHRADPILLRLEGKC